MTFKQLKNQIKEEQKQLALKIRRGKFLRKPKNRVDLTDNDKRLYFYRYQDYKDRFFTDTGKLSLEYRHIHVAYCEFFNKTEYGMIEQNPRFTMYFDRSYCERMKEHWESVIDEDVCSSAA
jgi:hypothetical protein